MHLYQSDSYGILIPWCFEFKGSVLPAITLVAASYAGYNKVRVIFMFTLTMGFLGNFFSGAKVNALDLSPNYAGSLMALTNGLAGLAGVGVLPAIGVLTPDVSVNLNSNHMFVVINFSTIYLQSTLEQWRFVFWITLVVSMVRALVFLVWGSGEIQPWNYPKKPLHLECDIRNDSTKNQKLIPS